MKKPSEVTFVSGMLRARAQATGMPDHRKYVYCHSKDGVWRMGSNLADGSLELMFDGKWHVVDSSGVSVPVEFVQIINLADRFFHNT